MNDLEKEEYLEYFEWLMGFIDCEWYDPDNYSNVLWKLYDTKFVVSIEKDQNRVDDALELRNRFVPWKMDSFPVSILEIMISMAIRIEDTIMKNTADYDRTAVWFWNMMQTMGLEAQFDLVYKDKDVINILHDFNNRRYQRNGLGGLFVTRDHSKDMRKMELWFQMHAQFHDILQDEGLLRKES